MRNGLDPLLIQRVRVDSLPWRESPREIEGDALRARALLVAFTDMLRVAWCSYVIAVSFCLEPQLRRVGFDDFWKQ